VFVKLAFVILLLGLVIDHGRFFGTMLMGLLWLGLTHVLFLHGWEWAQDISHGVRNVSHHLGAPAYSPSDILQLGAYVANPLLTSVANQGLLGYALHPSSLIFALAGVAMYIAFAILAFVQFAFLLTNYLLIGSSPFFLMWLPLPGLSAIAQAWISLACGNLSGLFVCGLIAGIMRDLGQAMAERYQSVFANAAGTTTLTWIDYAEPTGTAIILAVAFAWIPLSFSRQAFGVAGALWSGGGMLLGAASHGVTMPSKTTNSTAGGSRGWQSGAGGGSQQQISAPQQQSGSSMGQAQRPAQSAWRSE
jgi:hypothetical protein